MYRLYRYTYLCSYALNRRVCMTYSSKVIDKMIND